jgi:hypothetical protein
MAYVGLEHSLFYSSHSTLRMWSAGSVDAGAGSDIRCGGSVNGGAGSLTRPDPAEKATGFVHCKSTC